MPTWILELHGEEPIVHAIGVLALVCVGGLALGRIEVRGIRLGAAGVLFIGILTGSFSTPVSHDTLGFVKELGLILFVFTIGVQLGPADYFSLQGYGTRGYACSV